MSAATDNIIESANQNACSALSHAVNTMTSAIDRGWCYCPDVKHQRRWTQAELVILKEKRDHWKERADAWTRFITTGQR